MFSFNLGEDYNHLCHVKITLSHMGGISHISQLGEQNALVESYWHIGVQIDNTTVTSLQVF